MTYLLCDHELEYYGNKEQYADHRILSIMDIMKFAMYRPRVGKFYALNCCNKLWKLGKSPYK